MADHNGRSKSRNIFAHSKLCDCTFESHCRLITVQEIIPDPYIQNKASMKTGAGVEEEEEEEEEGDREGGEASRKGDVVSSP
jgi:hypothetical protein